MSGLVDRLQRALSQVAAAPAVDPLPLRDVHLPPAPSVWPPAPGWWIVFATVLLGGIAWVWWRRHVRRRRAEIERLFDEGLLGIDGTSARIAAMSELLRRAARRRDPAAVTLSGDEWLRFLDAGQRTPVFSAGAGRTLLEGGFRRDVSAQEVDALRYVVRERFVELMVRGSRRNGSHRDDTRRGDARRRWPWSRRRT